VNNVTLGVLVPSYQTVGLALAVLHLALSFTVVMESSLLPRPVMVVAQMQMFQVAAVLLALPPARPCTVAMVLSLLENNVILLASMQMSLLGKFALLVRQPVQ
jgi:hypothetical protein